MNGQPGNGFPAPKPATVAITGGTAADRDELRRRLEAAGLARAIETAPDAADSASEQSIRVGVARIGTPEDDEGHPISEDRMSTIVVGSDVDVAAAYEAGASQVIPLAVSDLPEAAIDRMVARLRRGWREGIAADLLDRAPVGVTLHSPETGEIVAHNSLRSILGLNTDEVSLSDLAVRGGVERSDLVAAIERAAQGAETTIELSDIPDGDAADSVESRFEAVTVGGERFVVGWLVDISERAEREREVDRYETILESLGDAVYAIDADGTIEYVNEKYVSMKGVDREELIGTNLYGWASEEAAERAKEIRRQMEAGEIEVGRLEYEFRSAAGETTPAEIRFVEMSSDGEVSGGAGVIRDISKQKSYERRLERQNERLEEFASVVSHDLRNPLNVAAGRLELAMEECDSDHLDAVADAHDRMTELIDNLLALAREGDDVRELEPVDLASLVENCWANVETGDATIEVSVDRPIRADRGRLRQIVENLIRNSVEHGSTGSRSETHWDSVEHAGDDVVITVGSLDDGFYVEDDGPGIPPEDRDSVFEAGYSTDPEGTGFGLSIVKQVAEAHGWTVRLTDAAGGGARFEFTGVAFAAE